MLLAVPFFLLLAGMFAWSIAQDKLFYAGAHQTQAVYLASEQDRNHYTVRAQVQVEGEAKPRWVDGSGTAHAPGERVTVWINASARNEPVRLRKPSDDNLPHQLFAMLAGLSALCACTSVWSAIYRDPPLPRRPPDGPPADIRSGNARRDW